MRDQPAPTSYFDAGGVTIYRGDARDLLPLLPASSVDLLLTDPPYGIRWKATSMRKRALPTETIHGDDGSVDVDGILRQSMRLLRSHAHLYVFGPFDLGRINASSPVTLIWHKGRALPVGNLNIVWGKNYEPIQFGLRGSGTERTRGALSARKRRGAVLSVPRLTGAAIRHHLTPKPVPLLRQLIESSSLHDEVVLDPFMGSGSTLVAAVIEGRRAMGVEIEERYCEIAARRVVQAQQTMAPAVGL
jgi:site-specific DNA-methyltransferase (adenine-specific)